MVAIPLLKPKAHAGPLGIIDIGSNSIRLVIYEGANRIPSILFNEKIMAGLGRGLAKTGALDPEAVERSLLALARFRRLAEDMGVGRLRTVATAAVRDATNGQAFIDELAAMDLPVELITGDEEAQLAGHGVLAAIPEADGIVGDLGGGSLELIRVRQGDVGQGISMPLGVLRLGALKLDSARLDRTLSKMLAKGGWREDGKGKPFYLVGGSWRALARLHMVLSEYPLPIIHHYAFPTSEARRLVRALGQLDPKRIKELTGIATSRLASLGPAAMLLAALVRRIEPSELVVSSYGLREGLLHRSLPADVRTQDPLLCATRDEGVRQGRFAEHGDLLNQWIAPLFAGEPHELERLRHASCLLGDVGWRAHPEFRAERGVETALHGNWVGIDAPGRALMSQALFTHFGGDGLAPRVGELVDADHCDRAIRWGLAMRLGQRLSGGVAGPLRDSRLQMDQNTLVLELRGEDVALYGEAVERRHKLLAESFGRRAVVKRIS